MAKITKEYQAKGNEFQVTYQRGNGPFSCVIVCAESAEVVRAWYAQENPKNKIVAVEKAAADDLKPGKSLYQVPDEFVMPAEENAPEAPEKPENEEQNDETEDEEMNEENKAMTEEQQEEITEEEQKDEEESADEQAAENSENMPTLRNLIHAFEKSFQLANDHFYNGELEAPVITIQQGAKERAYGWVSLQKVWHEEKGGEYRELNISAEYLQRGFVEVACTLLHEMIHIFNMMQGIQDTARRGIRHNQKFADAGVAHGMEPYKGDDYDKAGWRVKMTEETEAWAMENFKDLQNALTMYRDVAKKGEKKKTASRVLKYICPCCGQSVRATKEIYLICGDCKEDMTLEE